MSPATGVPYHRVVASRPDEGRDTPFGDERDLVQRLRDAAAERVAEWTAAREDANRRRSLNRRMNERALADLEAGSAALVASIKAQSAANLARIEEEAIADADRVRREEATVRADAERNAERAEEKAQAKYEERIWMAESVLEAALPAIRKRRDDEFAAADDARRHVDALLAERERIIRGYRQRPPRIRPDDAAPGDRTAVTAAIRDLEAAIDGLRACRAAGVFRGPILVVPAVIVPAIVAGLAAVLHGSLNMPRSGAALWGAVAGLGFVVIATGALWAVARKEVRQRHRPVDRAAALALGGVDRWRVEAERAAKEREAAARATHDADIAEADRTFKPMLADIERKLAEFLERVDRKAPHYHAKVLKQRSARIDAEVESRERALSEARDHRARAEQAEAERQRDVADEADRAEADRLAAAADRWRAAQQDAIGIVHALHERDRATHLEWNAASWAGRPAPARTMPFARIGRIRVPLSAIPGARPDEPELAWGPDAPPEPWEIPAFLHAPDRMSLSVTAPPERRTEGLGILQHAVARLLAAIPPGKARFTFVDPVALGQSFAGFMHMADELELLVTDRVWTDLRHIEQRLTDLTEHMETVIQKYLRNEYGSIEEYNATAGEIAEPYRFLVMADFPANVSEQAARRLASIVQSGARCGVHVLMLRDARQALPAGIDESDLRRGVVPVSWQDGASPGWRIDDGVLADLRFLPDPPPDDQLLQRIATDVGRAARESNRVEVPFSTVAPRAEERWSLSSAQSFRVPLGRSGANRLQWLALGEGTSQHALVAGKTGSGKSSLLNALIVGTALWYSPDEVEFWLVDFKKGVEFKAYAAAGLPHARAVAVESDREFGLSVLQGLDDELRRRGELFRSANVQNIADWRALGRPERMPRCLLVVDEFQELFVEDDKVSQDAALLLDRLVRQGRAFGMHVVLGSQTLGGAYGIARSTMGQMGVRIALQCTEADSQLILSDDNTAARLLTRPGEAIYNDAGGLVEGNSPFQVVWIGDEEREAQLRVVADTARTRPARERPAPIVFEGNQPADPALNAPLHAALARAEPGRERFAPKVWLGDAVSIKEPTHATLVRRSGSNIAVVGQRDEAAAALMAMAMVSIAAQVPVEGTRIVVLDGTTPDDRLHGMLAQVAAALPHRVELPTMRDAGDAVVALGQELAQRTADGAADGPGTFLLVNGIHRFRALRRSEDDYGFGGGDAAPTPDKVLALLLREGPSVGMHCIAWADTVANLQRSVDRNALREFEWKVLFQMGANDSSALIDGPAASRLGFHRALLSSEESGLLEKFRPYSLPDAGFLAEVAEALRTRAGSTA